MPRPGRREFGKQAITPLLLLPLAGSLTGRDRTGTPAATGAGAVRYASYPSPNGQGVLVEEGTTNTVQDPSFENATITTGWAVGGAAAISRDTTLFQIGAASAKVVCGAVTTDGISQIGTAAGAATVGQVWTASAWVRANAAGDVGKQVRLVLQERDGANALLASQSSPAITLTAAWQRVSASFTLGNAGVARVTLGLFNNAAVAVTFNADGCQLEQKAYPTSYADGTLGTGYTWAGTAHASASTRAATTVKIGPEASYLKSDAGAVACWFRREAKGAGFPSLFNAGNLGAGLDRITAYVASSNDLPSFNYDPNNVQSSVTSQAAIPVAGAVRFALALWRPGGHGLAIDGAGTINRGHGTPAGTTDTAADISIGGGFSGNHLDGEIGPVAFYDRALPLWTQQRLFAAGPAGLTWGAAFRPVPI